MFVHVCIHGRPAGFSGGWSEGALPWGFLACELVSHGKEQGSCCLSYLNQGLPPFPKLWECLHGHSCCGHSAQRPGSGVVEIGLRESAICFCRTPTGHLEQVLQISRTSPQLEVVSMGTGGAPPPCFWDSESEEGYQGTLSPARISRSQK